MYQRLYPNGYSIIQGTVKGPFNTSQFWFPYVDIGVLSLGEIRGFFLWCARHGAILQGASPEHARQGEVLAERQGCPPRGGI